jgi:4-hydroxy-tetrahydrodipicolinate reductase
MAKLKIAVAGSGGRMGRALLEAVHGGDDVELNAALEAAGSPFLGKNAGELVGAPDRVTISADIGKSLAGCDALIDFTRPEGTLAHLAACHKLGVNMVIGTTGFDDAQKKSIVEARVLKDGYDVEIIEAHHKHKIDAPSGTALHIGGIIAGALGRKLDECAVYGREGVTGERKASTIGFATVRGGDIVGEHTVMFAGPGERVEIVVRSNSRATYAEGDMQDVLGLR